LKEDVMEKRTFAFRLADKRPIDAKWKARDGVAIAGCSDPTGQGDYRYKVTTSDNGEWC
jgi:hypothetical protein